MTNGEDKELLKIMEDSLRKYVKAASLISQTAFELLSERNGLLWSEITTQIGILEEISKIIIYEEKSQEEKQPAEELVEERPVEEKPSNNELNATVNEQWSGKGTDGVSKDQVTVNEGPVNIYNKVVSFLKRQKCNELQWIRTYSFNCAYEGDNSFQIKYFEHKDAMQSKKNYIMFGNARKNFSIRKSGDDVIGDTSECFEFILNLPELLKN